MRSREAIVGFDNPAKDMLVRLARQHGAYVGGSMLMQRGDDVYNTYCLAGPDGRVQMHDKDQPTMWENAYYIGGSDDGVMETEYGMAGVAVCWELVRWRTIRRFAAGVHFCHYGQPVVEQCRELAGRRHCICAGATVQPVSLRKRCE